MVSALSVLLCCCLWFSALSLNASAASDEGVLFVSDMTTVLQKTVKEGSTETTYNVPFTEAKFVQDGILFHSFMADDPSFWGKGHKKILNSFDITNVVSGHSYTLRFYHYICSYYTVKVLINSTNVYEEVFREHKTHFTDVTFKMPDNLSSNTAHISISFIVPESVGHDVSNPTTYRISEEIEFNDNTDNPGWLGKILKKFSELGDRIGNFFTSLYSSISALGDRIGVWFSDLGKSIGKFFTDLWNNLRQSFADVGRWFQELGDKIGQWFKELGDKIGGFFVDLYNDIIQGLKDLFIPADDYFDNYMQKTKDWAKLRFGFLYTAGELMLDVVMDLKDLLRDDYQFTIPEAQFTLNGQTYTLWEAYTVPMKEYINTNTFMKVAYGTYITLLSSFALAFALFSYAQRVFAKIMAN